MNKMKKGDEVILIAGKDKGKTGRVLAMVDKGERVLVEGANLVKKHVKPNPQKGEQGGIKQEPRPVHRSNVMLIDASQKRSRVGIRILNDGKRVRYFKSNDELIDVKE